jgi:hypothetical protein
METTRLHVVGNSGGPQAAASERATAPRRDVVLAVVVVAILVTGAALGGSLAARQEPLLAQPIEISGAEPPLEFEYFPSKYVNQGVESSADLPTF